MRFISLSHFKIIKLKTFVKIFATPKNSYTSSHACFNKINMKSTFTLYTCTYLMHVPHSHFKGHFSQKSAKKQSNLFSLIILYHVRLCQHFEIKLNE